MGAARSMRRAPICGYCDRRMKHRGSRVTGDGVVREAYQCLGCDKLVFSDAGR